MVSGDSYAYDAREGAIGDTVIRHSSKPPPHLRSVVVSIRPRHSEPKQQYNSDAATDINTTEPLRNDNKNNSSSISSASRTAVDARAVINQFSALLHGCILTSEDIYTTQIGTLEIVGRITELAPEVNLDEEADGEGDCSEESSLTNGVGAVAGGGSKGCGRDEEYEVVETYRGIVGADTEFYVTLENSLIDWDLNNVPQIPTIAPHRDLVDIYTKDEEHFPVLRRLLRPCLSLTYAVQQGRGIYGNLKSSKLSELASNLSTSDTSGGTVRSDTVLSELVTGSELPHSHVIANKGNFNSSNNSLNETVKVLVDVCACTFDKVLLYLEHEVTYCTVLNCIVLYCTVLNCTAVKCTVLYVQ